ncbi:MAG: hypothetical protein Q9M32_02640 [Sulfurimonas sp.]|nr:hypothetical protein [Sulfurimonas sp.]MDQ7062445.1 hypothetical protein [Sulfurimonas sp.]
MSKQTNILKEIHEIVMNILKSGTATVEEADKIDELEALLHKQNCFKEISHPDYSCQGEEIAKLFFDNKTDEATDKMCEYKITPEDFFGFAQYHYDDEHEDEALVQIFTNVFIADVHKAYTSKCK